MATPSALALALVLSAPQGHLTVDTQPVTEISVDGQSMGKTPLVQFALPAGTHQVQLTNTAKHISVRQSVRVTSGQDSVVHLVLDDDGSGSGTPTVVVPV